MTQSSMTQSSNDSIVTEQVLLQLFHCLVNPLEAGFPAKHLQGFKQWRRRFAATYGYTNGLKHLAGFETQAVRLGP